MNPNLDDVPPDRLARLLDVEQSANWSSEDSGAILRHQLAAPLLPDLQMLPGAEPVRLKALIAARPGAESFDRQLTHISPSLELLESIKHFARHLRDDPASPLDGAPATVLYFAAIAAALLRCNKRITQLTDEQLREGFSWAIDQPGAESLTYIFRDALPLLANSSNR